MANAAELLQILRIGHETSIRGKGISLRQAMTQTKYRDLRSTFAPKEFIPLIGADLSLVERWLGYSEDKRTNGGWYVTQRGEVGRVGVPETQISYVPSWKRSLSMWYLS